MSNGTDLVLSAERLPKPANAAAETLVKGIMRVLPALPTQADQNQFAHACVMAANELEKECTPISVLFAALNTAKIGLMPGKTNGLAYFVPFWNKEKRCHEAQLIVGYRGYLDLAYGNSFLKDIDPQVVCEGEKFEQWSDEDGFHFRHDRPMEREPSRDNIVGAYCVARLNTGGKTFRWVSKKDIEACYNDQSPAWKYRYSEMALKCPIRRAAKHWKLTPQMALAVRLDEDAELGRPQECHVQEAQALPEVIETEAAETLDDYLEEPDAPPAEDGFADEIAAQMETA